MGFSGTLATLHFAEILQWCKNGNKTGTVTIGRRGIKKEIFVEKGRIISASSDNPMEYLGQYLISLGRIDEEQLQQAFEVQKKTRILLGKILVLRKAISEKDLQEALTSKIMDMVFNIFLWQTGKFHFSDKTLSEEHRRIQIALDIDSCVLEGARRVDEWKRFRAVFPDDRIVLAAGERKLRGGEKKKVAGKLIGLVEEGMSIEEMCLETRSSTFSLLEQLFHLHEKGYVRKTEQRKAGIKAVVPAGEKKFRSDEKEITHLYGKVLPPERVPALRVSIDELRSITLASKEYFVLSRVNGRWDVRSVVMMCPFSELEVLRTLKKLLDEEMIALD